MKEFTLGCTIVHFCVSLFTVRQPGVEHVKLGSYRILHQRADAKGAEAGGGKGPDLSKDFVILPLRKIQLHKYCKHIVNIKY